MMETNQWNTPKVDLPFLRRIDIDSRILRCKTSFYIMKNGVAPTRAILWLHGSGNCFTEMIGGVAKTYMKEMARHKSGGNTTAVVFPYCLPDLLWLNTSCPEWRIEDYLTKELIEKASLALGLTIDTSWEVHGYSMGGYAALRIGMKLCCRFRKILAMGAGPLGERFEDHMKGDSGVRNEIYRKVFASSDNRYKRCSPLSICTEMQERIRVNNQRIRIVVGDKDKALNTNENLAKRMSRMGINVQFEKARDIEHRLDRYLAYLMGTILS